MFLSQQRTTKYWHHELVFKTTKLGNVLNSLVLIILCIIIRKIDLVSFGERFFTDCSSKTIKRIIKLITPAALKPRLQKSRVEKVEWCQKTCQWGKVIDLIINNPWLKLVWLDEHASFFKSYLIKWLCTCHMIYNQTSCFNSYSVICRHFTPKVKFYLRAFKQYPNNP